MTPREIRHVRLAEKFMPRLWDFAYPSHRRGYRAARRIALVAWAYAFKVRVRLWDV
jgi:hypothetical protein